MLIHYSGGSLTTRTNKRDGRYYCAQFRYHTEGDKKWRTKLVTLTDQSGERIKADKNMSRNKREAKDALERASKKLSRVAMDSGESVPVYVMDCIEGRRGSVSDSTIRGYRDYRKVFERGLSNVAMKDITTKDVRLWIHGLVAEGLAPRTIRKAFNLLESVCDTAVEDEDIPANPCTRSVRKELPSVPTSKPNALDDAGIRRVNGLLDACENQRLKIGARLALHCGLRAGEVCGLRWEDIDLESGVLHVRTAIGDRGTLRKDGEAATYQKPPKSQAGTRNVPMTETVINELSEWRAQQKTNWGMLKAGMPFGKTFVIGYADGTWYSPRSIEHAWNNLARGRHARDPEDRRRYGDEWEPGREPIAGITGDKVTFHGLRHTYATVLVKAGIDIKTASALLGHADATLTLNVYAAADPDVIKAAGTTTGPLLEVGTRRMALRAV